jgi:hypothetical protein
LGGSVAKVFPSDLPKFREAVTDVTKRVGMLAAVKHVDSTEAGTAISRAISGTTGLGELMQMALFERSPQFTSALRAETAKIGLDLKDWKDTTDQVRLGVIQRALKTATPDSLIGEFEGTVESLWQGIQTRINDPLTGMFGFLRDIPSLNNTTVMDAVKDFLQAFIRMTTQFGRLAKDLGIDFDPLAPIARFITWLATVQYAIGAAFEYRTFSLENILGLTDIAKGFGAWMNRTVRGAFRALEKLDVGTAGNILALLFTTVPNFLSNIFKSVNWANLGFVIGAAIGKYMLVWQIALPKNVLATTQLFLTGLWAVFTAIIGALLGLFYGLVIEPLKPTIKAFTDPIVQFFTWLGDGIKLVWETVKGLLAGVTNTLSLPGQMVQGISSVVAPVAPVLSAGMNLAGSLWDTITGKKKDPKADPAKKDEKGNPAPATTLPIATPGASTTAKPGIAATVPAVTVPGAMTPAITRPGAPVAPKAMAMVGDSAPIAQPGVDGANAPAVVPLDAGNTIAMADTKPLPLPSVQSQTTNNAGTYAPQITVPVSQGMPDTNDLVASITNVLERQYADFKRSRLAHAV